MRLSVSDEGCGASVIKLWFPYKYIHCSVWWVRYEQEQNSHPRVIPYAINMHFYFIIGAFTNNETDHTGPKWWIIYAVHLYITFVEANMLQFSFETIILHRILEWMLNIERNYVISSKQKKIRCNYLETQQNWYIIENQNSNRTKQVLSLC